MPCWIGRSDRCGGTSTVNDSVTLRTASPSDVPAIHRLITDNLEVGHLAAAQHRGRRAARGALRRRRRSTTRSSAAPSSRRSAARSPKCARSSSTRRSAASTSGPDLVSQVATTATAQRILDAVRVHARAVAFRAHGLHDRAAHLGAGEDRARLHGLRALPALRPARGDAARCAPASRSARSCRRRSFTARARRRRRRLALRPIAVARPI